MSDPGSLGSLSQACANPDCATHLLCGGLNYTGPRRE
jgi:hypothetical protein